MSQSLISRANLTNLDLIKNTMKFALALLAFSAVNATQVETTAEIEGWNNSYSGYSRYGNDAVRTVRRYVKTNYYNGHGHHSDSDDTSSSDSSYSSDDYSDSDYGYGYRHYHGRHRYYRYTPKYSSGRYYYGSRYTSRGGVYRGTYRTLGSRSYTSCNGCIARPSYYSYSKW